MYKEKLRTLKEVAEIVHRPPHRIIHLCEQRVVVPAVDAKGRGTVRRFTRDDLFRVRLGLDMQDAGVVVPMIKPVMIHLNRIRNSRIIAAFLKPLEKFDTVDIIGRLGTRDDPVLVLVTPPPPGRIAFVTPRFNKPLDCQVELKELKELLGRGVSFVANLTAASTDLPRIPEIE